MKLGLPLKGFDTLESLKQNVTRMRGKAQRDGRPAVKWMETFTRDMGKVAYGCDINSGQRH